MTDKDFIIESQKIGAVGALEEIAEMAGMLLDDGDISRADFPFPRIYRMVRAIDRLARGELHDQAAQEKLLESA